MPNPGSSSTPSPAKVGETQTLSLLPMYIIVCFSLTCCKESSDFTPGDIMGINRIYPHAMIMASAELEQVQAVITVIRPATTIPHDDEMGSVLRPILYTDTNTGRSNIFGPPLPTWDNFFDYYELDPIGNGVGVGGALTMVDSDPASARSRGQRVGKRLIQKETPKVSRTSNFYEDADLTKLPRQGDFDNIHIAPKMKVRKDPHGAGPASDPKVRAAMGFDDIAMAPFCVHDCLHTHLRWGLLGYSWIIINSPMPKSNCGFDQHFNPYTVEGAPMVPHNQSVRLTILPPSGFAYEGIVHSPVEPGRWHVIFHHGMGYANDIWDVGEVDAARAGVETASILNGERNFTPQTATNSFALFYWRMRFGVEPFGPAMERVGMLVPAACRSL